MSEITNTIKTPAEDIAFVLEQLDKSEAAVQQILSTLTEEQFIFKADEETWSISENLEHVILFDRGVFGTIVKLSKNMRDTYPEGTPAKEVLMKIMTKRATKVKAPEFAVPTGKYTNKEELFNQFVAQHNTIKTFVQNFDGDLRKVAFKHFLIGLIDGIGWLTNIAGHCMRHVIQMKEIMEAETFPKV